MASYLHFYFVVTLMVIVIEGQQSKYSKHANEASDYFRINALNVIYRKAVNRIEGEDLEKLLKGLKDFDQRYITAKQDFADGKDTLEVERKAVDKELTSLLSNLHVGDLVDALSISKAHQNELHGSHYGSLDDKFVHGAASSVGTEEIAADDLADARLKKLWRSAVDAGFTQEELSALKLELKDHQQKMQNYRDEVQILSKMPDENSIDFDHSDDMHAARRREVSERLKKMNLELQDGLSELTEKVADGENRWHKSGFTHPKTKQLWSKALDSKRFSPQELESLKEELKHFELRLQKLEYIQQEVETANRAHIDKKGKVPDPHDYNAKLKDYTRKTDKLENYLRGKIVHSEL